MHPALRADRRRLEEDVHQAAIASIVASYWRDFAGHEAEFVPGFLANDILRMWRTFCVNYEARTSSDPPEKKAKRALSNQRQHPIDRPGGSGNQQGGNQSRGLRRFSDWNN